jgi:hypothetical protein
MDDELPSARFATVDEAEFRPDNICKLTPLLTSDNLHLLYFYMI